MLSGGPELADELERTGYEGIAAEVGIDELTVEMPKADADPFSDPTTGRTRSPTRSPSSSSHPTGERVRASVAAAWT